MNRRFILIGASSVLFARFSGIRKVLANNCKTESCNLSSIEWHIPREQLKDVKVKLNFEGKVKSDPSSVKDTKGLPLIYILVGAVALAELAKTLLDIYRDVRFGGIIVKQENGKIRIDNDRRLSSGTIIISKKDGVEVTFRDKDNPKSKDLIEALGSLVKK
jgi:hypothetical protein